MDTFQSTLPISDTDLCLFILSELQVPVVTSFTTNLLVDRSILSALLLNRPATDLGNCIIEVRKGRNITYKGSRLRPVPSLRDFLDIYNSGQINCKIELGYPSIPAWEVNTDDNHIIIDFISHIARDNFNNEWRQRALVNVTVTPQSSTGESDLFFGANTANFRCISPTRKCDGGYQGSIPVIQQGPETPPPSPYIGIQR